MLDATSSAKNAFNLSLFAIFLAILGGGCDTNMTDNAPPPPPSGGAGGSSGSIPQHQNKNIVDMRDQFARKTPLTAEESAAATRAFIEGKIEMVRRDPHMTDAEKAAAIASLETKLR
jgi:hypothetical protein